MLDTAYKYNINSNAPTTRSTVAPGNSLAAYVYGYGGEQTARQIPTTDPLLQG